MTEWTAITEDEAAVLNAARDTLKAIEDRSMFVGTWEAGFLRAVTETASTAVFQVLNCASVYGPAPLSDDVIHNRKGATA